MAAKPATALPIHRLDVETYNQMVASGALEGQPVELLEGLIVEMSPKSRSHVAVVTRLMRHFAAVPRWWTQVQDPIEVPPSSEPEPDLAVFADEPSPSRHPQTALLVVEVAVSSHAIDRGLKAKLYAAAGIPVYWMVDVRGGAVEVYTDPGPDGYRRREVHRHSQGTHLPSPLEGVKDLDLEALFDGVVD